MPLPSRSFLAQTAAVFFMMAAGLGGRADAAPRVIACAGVAALGAAQIGCSHTDPEKPAQLCSFSWSLIGPDNTPRNISGTFLVQPHAANITIWQGAGYSAALADPVVLCHGQRS